MKDTMEANTGIDMDAELIAFLIARRTCILRISRLRSSFNRWRKLVSHPKNLTNLTDDIISCVSETRWSVILVMAFLRLNNDLIALVSSGTTIVIRAKP